MLILCEPNMLLSFCFPKILKLKCKCYIGGCDTRQSLRTFLELQLHMCCTSLFKGGLHLAMLTRTVHNSVWGSQCKGKTATAFHRMFFSHITATARYWECFQWSSCSRLRSASLSACEYRLCSACISTVQDHLQIPHLPSGKSPGPGRTWTGTAKHLSSRPRI